MIAHAYEHTDRKRFGKDRKGNQRWRCLACGVTWTDQPAKVLGPMRIPVAAKIDGRRTKKILRESQAARLPAEVLTRPKQGFGVPLRAWLAGPARAMLEELTAPEAIAARGLFDPAGVAALKRDFYARRVDSAFTLFPMMAIELWCRALDRAPVFASSHALHYPAAEGTA